MLQVALSLMVNEPKPGDASYESHMEEKGAGLASLRRRAHIMTDGFNSLEGVSCNFTEGAMYSFPRIRLPPKVIALTWTSCRCEVALFFSLVCT